MANRSSILPIELINLNVYREDLNYLRGKFGSGATARIGYGPAMREIIHAAVKRLREKERDRLTTTKYEEMR